MSAWSGSHFWRLVWIAWGCFSSSLWAEGGFTIHFAEISLSGRVLFPECFSQPSGLWKEIGWKEKQFTCTSLSPSLMYHLSSSLALRSSSLLEDGSEYRHFSSFSGGERFVVYCRSSSYFLWSPAHVNWKCSSFGHSAFFPVLGCESASTAVIFNPFFFFYFFSPAFLLAAVLYYTLFYIHSLALVPDVSVFRKKSWAVVAVKDA